MTEVSYERAREFVYATARVLEQRLFATLFEGAPATGVVDSLRAYRNEDGGFGHGLEPDARAPASQPVDVWFAFDTLVAAGAPADELASLFRRMQEHSKRGGEECKRMLRERLREDT